MEQYLEVCKNYMLFLCKDEDYTKEVSRFKKKDGEQTESN